MSTFQDLLNIIGALQPGATFSITKKWCIANGLSVNTGIVRGWGRKFANCFGQHNCARQCVSPTQGTASHKSSNNLCHYVKI